MFIWLLEWRTVKLVFLYFNVSPFSGLLTEMLKHDLSWLSNLELDLSVFQVGEFT